jgi:predicted phage terminase large subunit-like protein
VTATVEAPPPAPSLAHVEARVAQLSLIDLVQQAWPIVEPAITFAKNWHVEVICEHLEAVSRGECRRLIINIPPGYMKSLSVAVFWPVWDWMTKPSRRWVFASYAEKLSKRDSLKCRRIIESPGGREDGGTLIERVGYYGMLELLGLDWRLTTDQNEKLRFENDATGYRLATSVGGVATGEGAEILVIDDPHKADETESETKRKNVLEWLDGTISTRLRPPDRASMVVVMQRLHEDDVTGHLLEQGGYEHLCLPAEYEPSHPFVWPDDPRTEAGELLWPDMYGPEENDELKVRLGSYRTAGQLQQRPSPEEGGILKRYYWRYYPVEWLDGEEWPDTAPAFTRIWQSWDTALKEKTSSDFTVGTLWGADLANRYLLRRVRGRWGLTESKEQMRQLTAWADGRFPHLVGHQKRVENTANGPEIIAALRGEIPGIVPVTVDTDKVSRAFAVTPQLEAGNVHVPGRANQEQTGPDATTPSWVQEFIDECAAFPNGAFDDQVDSMTQALDPSFKVGPPRQPRGGGRKSGMNNR